jgi:putative tryptophan/tyrosine transport system substrate-binding protein
MERRVFIAALAGGLLEASLGAEGQQPKTNARVGMLLTGSPSDTAQSREQDAFKKKLGELGWVEGRNLIVEVRSAENPDRLPVVAAELVRAGIDVILTPGPAATAAVRSATSSIPIVMIASTDPRTLGAAGLAHPGGNVTGLTIGQPELVNDKRLEILKEALPGLRRVATVWDVSDKAAGEKSLVAAAKAMKIDLRQFDIASVTDYARAFATAKQWRAGAVLLVEGPRAVVNRAIIAKLGLKHRLPVMAQFSRLVEAGGLMSYGPDLTDLFDRAASYVDKILRGSRPGELPIEQPTKFALVLNRTTARVLGISIPPSLLVRVDRMID